MDKAFSLFIRLRDTDDLGIGKCITCNKRVFWKEADAGHFISRTYLGTRFDDRNVNLQCKGCNGFKNGEQYKHGVAINMLYGDDTADELWAIARGSHKWDRARYIETIAFYNSRVQSLREQKQVE
tara:strand:+ start:369 stop:743 length:375 start_codon:yes stop_codon:yes gene_type:complete